MVVSRDRVPCVSMGMHTVWRCTVLAMVQIHTAEGCAFHCTSNPCGGPVQVVHALASMNPVQSVSVTCIPLPHTRCTLARCVSPVTYLQTCSVRHCHAECNPIRNFADCGMHAQGVTDRGQGGGLFSTCACTIAHGSASLRGLPRGISAMKAYSSGSISLPCRVW